jgi:hypothetical protein
MEEEGVGAGGVQVKLPTTPVHAELGGAYLRARSSTSLHKGFPKTVLISDVVQVSCLDVHGGVVCVKGKERGQV